MRQLNRAAETTTSTGVGDLTLLGALTGYQALSGIGNGNVFPYIITEYPAAVNWEVGVGTYVTGPARLQRTTVLASSNGGAAVNWGAGTKVVLCGLPANLSLLHRHEGKVAGFTAGAADAGKVFECTGTFTIAYAAAATLGAGWWCIVANKSGVQTHDPNAAETIDSAASFTTVAGENILVVCDGTEFHTIGRKTANTLDTTRIDVASASTVNLTSSAPNTRHINITGTTTITAFTVAAGLCYFVRFAGALTLTNNASIVTQTGANIVTKAGDTCILRATAANTVEVLAYTPLSAVSLGTAQNTTSGTSIDFTGIPAWAQRITMHLSSVSTNGTSNPLVQLGDSGGVENAGYVGMVGGVGAGSTGNVATSTAGMLLMNAIVAARVMEVTVILTLLDPAANTWSMMALATDGANVWLATATKSTSAVLDRVRLTTVDGTDTFDAGKMNITFE